MTELTADEVLDRAADVLIRDGWRRGDYGTNDGPKCLEGALIYALGGDVENGAPLYLVDDPERERLELEVDSIVRELLDHCPAITWNDADERTVDEVIELLRCAAKLYREERS